MFRIAVTVPLFAFPGNFQSGKGKLKSKDQEEKVGYWAHRFVLG